MLLLSAAAVGAQDSEEPTTIARTGILEINGSEAIVEYKKGSGVRLGDEYAIVREDTIGLLKISQVRENYSVAHILYSNPDAAAGDQLRAIRRIGIEFGPYFNTIIDFETSSTIFIPGIRLHLDRGVWTYRPLIGLEALFVPALSGLAIPSNIYLGGEINWYAGRFRIQPSAVFGIGASIPLSPALQGIDFVTHVGGFALVGISYLVSQAITIELNLGYAQWVGLYEGTVPQQAIDFYEGYSGVLVGVGVIF